MTFEAKRVISEILLDAQEHRFGTRGPFLIIWYLHAAYLEEWGWIQPAI